MRYRIVLMFIIGILLAPQLVSAKEYLDINCKKNKKDEYICVISVEYDKEVSAVEYTYTVPKNSSVKDFINTYPWEGTNDNNVISLYTDLNQSGHIELGTLFINSKKEIKSEDIKVEKLLIYDSNFEEIELINNVKNKENKVKKSNSWIYLTILCVIIIIVVVVFTIKKRGDAK